MSDEEPPKGGSIDPPPDAETEITKLAGLSVIDFEKKRVEVAKRLGVRKSILDKEVTKERKRKETRNIIETLPDPELWPNPVDGEVLLDTLAETVARHVVLSDRERDAVALWVLHAHAHDSAEISPILAITSPTPECGKSTLGIVLLGALTPRPLPVSNITTAALFRAVEKWHPTLLIDEADTFLKHSDELRGILNSGHTRAGAFVIRTTGDDYEPQCFTTWAAKVIVAIGKLPPTLASRSIHIELQRMRPGEDVEPLRADRLTHLAPLQQRCWRFALDKAGELAIADPDLPAALRGRSADNWRPLIAIADVAGGAWPERARRAAITLSDKPSEQTAAIMLLDDLYGMFEQSDRLFSDDIVSRLAELEDRPWPEWSKGKPITQRQLAKLLEGFKIRPKTIRIGEKTAKGYGRQAFEDVFSRWLTTRSVTPSQRPPDAGSSDLVNVTATDVVTDEKPLKPAPQVDCDGVTDEDPQGPWTSTL